MIGRGCGCKMPCESCAVQFSVFRRKRACSECERFYCAACLRRGGGMCAPCRTLCTRPLARHTIAHLKVRDLQCFLQRQNVSTRGCVEKEELVGLCVAHVNSASYRRRGSRAGASAFSSLKGLTTNLNDFINSAFDIRNSTQQAPPPQPPPPPPNNSSCFNTAHAHAPPPAAPPRERFTATPGGEADVRPAAPASPASAASAAGARVDTADCFEIEDLDDAGWEFVTRPADPLPNGVFTVDRLGGAPRSERGRGCGGRRGRGGRGGRGVHAAARRVGAGAAPRRRRAQRLRQPAGRARHGPRGRLARPSPHSDGRLQRRCGRGRGCGGDGRGGRGAGGATQRGGAGGAEREAAEGAAGAQPRGVPRLPRARRPAAARAHALPRPRPLPRPDGQLADRGVLQDLHGGAAGVRAAGVRPHRRVHRLRQAARRVPHLPPVRRARRALLPLLAPPLAPLAPLAPPRPPM